MTAIEHHLTDDFLGAYAAGTLSAGMELVAAGHLTFCQSCRDRVAAFEALGGEALSEETDEIEVADVADIFALIDADPTQPVTPKPAHSSSPLPTAVREHLGMDVDDIPWKLRLPGIHEYQLEGFGDEHVSLLKARPGAKMLAHTHSGDEATLILTGAMQDGDDILRKGDVATADHHDDHTPVIVGEEMCLCLIVMSGKMRFTGTFGRALNLIS